jgi:uncharacterized membrane protein YfcA
MIPLGQEVEVDVLAEAGAYILFPTMAFLAGMLGGMLGIGGGMIINPVLIEVGMHPQVCVSFSFAHSIETFHLCQWQFVYLSTFT